MGKFWAPVGWVQSVASFRFPFAKPPLVGELGGTVFLKMQAFILLPRSVLCLCFLFSLLNVSIKWSLHDVFFPANSKATCGPPPAFVIKVLLAHSHAHSFTFCLWLHGSGRVEQLRHRIGCKAENIDYLAPHRKVFQFLDSEYVLPEFLTFIGITEFLWLEAYLDHAIDQ